MSDEKGQVPGPEKSYSADVREQKIPLPGPEHAEKLRMFLEQFEVDSVIHVPGEGWVYLRKRAMAVEQTRSETGYKVPPDPPDNVTPIRRKRKQKPQPTPEPPAPEPPTDVS